MVTVPDIPYPSYQLLLQIRGTVAEYERSLITERHASWWARKAPQWASAPLDSDPIRLSSGPRTSPGRQEGTFGSSQMGDCAPDVFVVYCSQKRRGLYWIAKKLSDDGIPTPRGGIRWNVSIMSS